MITKRKRILILIMGICILCAMNSSPITVYARNDNVSTYKYDVTSKNYVQVIPTSKKYVSISPQIASIDIPSDVANVSVNVILSCSMQYDSITGRYVSAASPTVSLQYSSKVALRLESVSTSYRDNGSSVTFAYSGRLLGTVVADSGVVCSIDYGRINGSYTIKK